MAIIQTTARLPEQYRDLILSVCSRLREDAEFGPKLEAFMIDAAGAAVVYQLPPEAATRLDALESLCGSLAIRVEVLEAGRVWESTIGDVGPDAIAEHLDVIQAAPAEPPAALAPTPRKRQAVVKPASATGEKPSTYKPATPEQKAERKAFADEIKAAPGAQGLGASALQEKIATATGIAPKTVKNIMTAVTGSSAEARAKIRAAVGLEADRA